MDFDIRFRALRRSQRIEMIQEISSVIDNLNLASYPGIKTSLAKAEERIGLLRRIVKEKFDNRDASYKQIINMIEGAAD